MVTLATWGQATGWWEMGRRFREGGSAALEPANIAIFLAIVFGIGILLWALASFFQREGNEPFRGPRRLFVQLARAHRLDLRESWLLWKIARSRKLSQPAEVFVDPRLFDAEALPSRFQKYGPLLRKLRERLFR